MINSLAALPEEILLRHVVSERRKNGAMHIAPYECCAFSGNMAEATRKEYGLSSLKNPR
jgi:hypothetical protein